MKRLLMTTAIAVVPFLFPTMAHADCNDLSPGGGDTVTCTATDVFDGPDAIETRALDDGSSDVTVNVLSGAVIDTTASGEDAIKLKDDDNTVNNAGTIAGGDEAIVGGNGLTVDNDGTITALDQGITGENEDDSDADDVRVLNSGDIITEDRAINVGDGTGLFVENSAGASIQARDEGIQGGDGLTVENAGTITAVEKAIDANGDNVSITNEATGIIRSTANEGIEAEDSATIINRGTIEGFDDAIQVGENALIENYGTIENTQTQADIDADPGLEAQDAIDIDSGTIINEGTIRSTTNAAIDYDPGAATSTVRNSGLITGTIAVNTDDADTAGQEIFNAGTLAGTEGLALYLGQGEDKLVNLRGSEIVGGADFGTAADSMVFEADFFDLAIGSFAGGALFDGGEGEDTVSFLGLASTAISGVSLANGELMLSLLGTGGEATLRLLSWENFQFADRTLDVDGLVAAVPLPAGMLLFGTALAGLCVASRLRARA
jgi:hypothetical protein